MAKSENKKIKKIAVMTSGGDAPGLNACIRAVVRTAIFNKLKIVGIQHGFEGLISGDFIPMNANTVSNIIQLGGTILKSSRSERFKTKEGRLMAYKKIKKENIDAIILIGGDGSFEGAKTFTKEHDIPFIGIPKTIDNDIFGTDVCIGYDTALNTATQAIDKIRDTAQSHERIFIVEVMGRDSGYIAYGAGLAGGAEAILVPETKADDKNLKEVLRHGWNRNKSSLIIVVAEGDESGGALKVADDVKKYMPSHYVGVCILGHIQRGGSPSAADRILASKLGFEAIEGLLKGKRNVMVGIKRNEIHFTPLQKVKRHHLDINDNLLKMIITLTS
ncbi:MAG: 6-phosphofructokinase [Bacteroidota bacterium]|nr:6-phosphofructokinase [Bacteroidota bacterium]MDP3147320.1 6-phosphofructokinase [Bacteroidota bacterium]